MGDGPPPFLVDWIDGPSTHHSDQLGVSRYCPRDFKKDPMSRDWGWHFGRSPEIEGGRSSDRAEGKAFGITLP